VVVVSRGEAKRLRDILHRLASPDPIHTEVQKAILYLQEAVWKDQVVIHQVLLIVVLLQRAVGDPHIAADHLPDPTHPDHPHQDLHLAVAAVVGVLQEEDSLRQYSRVKTDHSKNRVQG
jgi:hypothetical protein